MKKIIYLTFFLLLSSLSSNAQETRAFRGFLDFFGGVGVGTMKETFTTGNYGVRDIHTQVAFGLNFTAGYQINDLLFAGIGFGGYTNITQYSEMYKYSGEILNYYDSSSDQYYFPAIMLPVFVDCRWTLDIKRKITPFVDLKIGYQFGCQLEDGQVTWGSNDEPKIFLSQEGGFYIQPTVGVRFGKASAFNLGITYNPTINLKLSKGPDTSNLKELKKFSQGAFMLSLGADF